MKFVWTMFNVVEYALWWGYKGQDYRSQGDIQPVAGASFEQNNSLSSHISISSVHPLNKPIAQIVLRVHIFKILQHKCMELQF